MDEIYLWVVVTVVALILLLIAERGGSLLRRTVLKTVASTGFVLAAIAGDATDTWYGRVVLIGLIFSWWGDILLLSRSERVFQAGLVCFLLAHVAYVSAFVVAGLSPVASLVGVALIVPILVIVARWVLPNVPSSMRIPVMAYMGVISLMVALAGGLFWAHGHFAVLLAAMLFWVSDLFVARDRFIAPGFANSVCGLPLYYTAQILFAYSVTLARYI